MTTETAPAPQEFQFQAEISRLLHLLSHSLYQNREIAIRELISNASDALDKFRHITLTQKQFDDGSELFIQVEPKAEEKVLTIRDNGIGMTKDELIKNLGTIAHSGSLEFLTKAASAKAEGDDQQNLSLIGQFGVGFYSSFMLSDTVEVLTRSYQEETGWRWTSDGSGKFSIEPAEGLSRGTQIVLHLKSEVEEFSRPVRLRHILRQYSTFVSYPIKIDDELVNDQKPIWVEPKSQVTDEQYKQFYGYISKRTDEEPLWHLHLTSDSPFQFHSILFAPPANEELLGFGRSDHGLHLCAKRVLVQNNCRELLPEYLRFIYGLVDSADLPLNVSREALQDNTVFRKIRKVLVKKVLGHLEDVAKDDAETYRKFYLQFGVVLREGISIDFENRQAIAKLLRYRSSNGDDRETLIGLDDYVSRMVEGQTQIYYVGGPDVRTIEKNPNLDAFRSRGIEVLYLIDPVDEFVLNHLHDYAEKPLLSIDAVGVNLPEQKKDESEEKKDDEKKEDETPVGLERVLALFRQSLGEQVQEVRTSSRLTSSPCCLVSPEGVLSAQLERVLRANSDEFQLSKRIFEVNAKHPLMRQLCELSAAPANDVFIKVCGQQLFSNLLILDGVVTNPHDVTDRVLGFMEELAQQKTGATPA